MTWRDDRGSGTLLGLVAAVLLAGGGIVAWSLAGLAVAHQRASVAADLAALAAARVDCAAANAVADANGGRLDACDIDGGDAVVTVSVAGPTALDRLGVPSTRVTASARAGPG